MKIDEILSIIHDGRINKDGGVIGSYNSIHNLIRNEPIYKSIYVENTRKSHVYSEPVYRIVEDKKRIINKLKKLDLEVLELMNEKCLNNSDFYEIIFMSGKKIQISSEKIPSNTKILLDDIIENNEYSGTTSEKFIDYPPILNYLTNNMNEKIDALEYISQCAINKKVNRFIKILSKNCICNIQYKNVKILGKEKISKYIKSFVGFLNFNIPYFVSSNIYGYINVYNQSDILLCISYYDRKKKGRFDRYISFEFKDGIIIKIEIYKKNEITAKKLNDVAISYIRTLKYDELNKEIVNNVKNNNKSYQELLEIAFPSKGIRTNMRDIRK